MDGPLELIPVLLHRIVEGNGRAPNGSHERKWHRMAGPNFSTLRQRNTSACLDIELLAKRLQHFV